MVGSQGGPKAGPLPPKLSGSKATSQLVGRDEELRRLSAALTLAAEGQGNVVLLSGEHGVGKTRLANEALDLAREREFTVLRGRAFPLREGLAYAPFLDAFGPLMRDMDSPQLTSLVEDLPELGRLFGGLRLLPLETVGDPALEKARIFEAMSHLLQRLTLLAPVVLFLDDIHWADPASLELLLHLAVRASNQRVLLLVTFDGHTLNTSDSLRALVVSLQQAGLADEIAVEHLGRDAVEKLVEGILCGVAPDGLIDFLDSQASGLPLFIEALVGALVDSGNLVHSLGGKDHWAFVAPKEPVVLPVSVRRFVLERLGRLALADRRIFDLIAVTGDATSYTVLRSASGLEEDTLVEGLWRLLSAGLVSESIEESDVAYRITHPLIRQVAYTELPEVARRRMKTTAGQAEKMLIAGEQANREAATVNATEHTDSRLTIGVDGYQMDSSDDEEESLPWLLERLGEAWERVIGGESAVAVWTEALAQRERAGDFMAVSRLHRRLALAEWDSGHFEIANAHVKASSAVLQSRSSDEPGPEFADVHITRQQVRDRLEGAADMVDMVARLLSAAERLSSPTAAAEVNLLAAAVSLEQGEAEAARDHASRALKLSDSLSEEQSPWIRSRAHSLLTLVGMRIGDHHLMRYNAERSLGAAQGTHAPRKGILARVRLAHAYFMAGSWDEAMRLSMEAIVKARSMNDTGFLAYALAGRAMLLALQGELPEAEACIAEVRIVYASGAPKDRQTFSLVDIAEAALALERGQVERALSIARSFVRLPASWEAAPAGVIAASMPLALMLLAEAQVAAGDPDSALETAQKLATMGPAGSPYPTALASRAEGLARLALGQRETATACLARAYETFTAIEMPFEAARCLLEQAMAATLGQPAVAATAAQACLPIFDRLGAQRYADRARRLLRGLGISPPSPRRTRLSGGALSQRELEVARLVAGGLTTAEIAERLSVSPRTVTTHLEHIYARLGIASRSALVRYVTEAGLLLPKDENA